VARIASIDVVLDEFKRKNRNSKGNNFCHVERMMHRGQDKPAITFGNQKWRGAAPNFVIKPTRRSHLGRSG